MSTRASPRTLGRWRGRRLRRVPSVTLCAEVVDVPAVGGIQVDDETMTRYAYLPDYVVLWEPSHEEVWAVHTDKKKMRSIFLNQPLEPWEHAAVEQFRAMLKDDMQLGDDEELPRWILPHLTRLLQQCKYQPLKALHLWPQLFEERVKKLPINYDAVRVGLAYGMVYFHGRDKCCRPLLTIRIGRSGPFFGKPELIKLVFLYTMEFAVRYLLVPGRVENWSVVIDCAGTENLPSFWKVKDVANAIATSLGKVYSGRMAWTKIFNFPTGFGYKALKVCVESIISALGKSDKVAFIAASEPNALAAHVELGQLEEAFGGTAPNLPPAEVFPPRMFSTREGYSSNSPRARTGSDFSVSSDAAPSSMHLMTDLQFHEGLLCADCLQDGTKWKERISQLPLPHAVAQQFGGPYVKEISPWCEVMADAAGLTKGESQEQNQAHDVLAPTPWPASIIKEDKEETGAAEDPLKAGAGPSSQSVTSAAPAAGEVMQVQPAPEDGFGSGKANDDLIDAGRARASPGTSEEVVAAPGEKPQGKPPAEEAVQVQEVAASGQMQDNVGLELDQMEDPSAQPPGCCVCAVS